MSHQDLDFVTMGMFIVDDIYYSIPRAPVTDIIGGAGSYAVLGARIMRGSGHTVGWTIHAGSDFPETVRKEVQSWGTRCEFVDTPERLTTRGLNVYREKEKRGKSDFQTPVWAYWGCGDQSSWFTKGRPIKFTSCLLIFTQ